MKKTKMKIQKEINRTAVILCGGKGTRLGQLGKKIPKALVKIHGNPILWYIINILKQNNFNHFILPLGYKGHLIKKFISSKNSLKKNNIDLVFTGENSNISQRIWKIQKLIKSENFLLLNGDAIFDFGLNKVYKNHIKKKIDMTFIAGANTYSYGTVGFKNGRVIDFKRNLVYDAIKVRNKNNYTAYSYTGMSIINIKLLDQKYKHCKNFEKDLFPNFVKNFKCDLVHLKGFWHSMDNMKDISAINNKKLNNSKFYKLKKIIKKI